MQSHNPSNLDFYRTHEEEEQGDNFVIESIDLGNWDDESKPWRHFTY